tara:strand:- start:18343 stop:18531 length:189 start_codon:yes stop_codon:yes gene_type:complete
MSRERLIARAIAEITVDGVLTADTFMALKASPDFTPEDDGTDFYMTAHPSTTPFNLPNGPIC